MQTLVTENPTIPGRSMAWESELGMRWANYLGVLMASDFDAARTLPNDWTVRTAKSNSTRCVHGLHVPSACVLCEEKKQYA